MEIRAKYRKFLLSKNSNFISYAISKFHSTYIKKDKRNRNLYQILSFFRKMSYIFDDSNKYQKNKGYIDAIIISNLVSANENKNDLYFGNLSIELKKKKIKTLSVYRNHTFIRSKKIKNLFNNHNKILLSKRLDFINEIKIVIYFFNELLLLLFSKKYSFIKENLALRDLFSIIPNLRLVYQIDELLRIYSPKAILFTYEGHAWERLLVYMCKNYNNKIKSIAYQFSIIKKKQFGFFNKLKKNYNPDYIATSGSIPHNIIKKKIKFSNLIKLGSPKFTKNDNNNIKTIDLLVALDSNQKYFFKMFNFCRNFANKNPNFRIVLRPHPILTNDKKLLDEISKNINKIKNIKISNNSLAVDLKRCRYLLYLDSVIGINCLNYGVKPLFFYVKNVPNIFDGNFPKKYVIKNYSDLQLSLKNKKIEKISNYFINYRDNYFEKFNIYSLKKIFK